MEAGGGASDKTTDKTELKTVQCERQREVGEGPAVPQRWCVE